jgi:hypothetical protein
MTKPQSPVLKAFNKDFQKGSVGADRAAVPPSVDSLAAEGVRQFSVYYWAWRYLRMSPVFLFATTRRVPPRIERARTIYEHGGGIALSRDFESWWSEFGVGLFAESMPWPTVTPAQGRSSAGLVDEHKLVIEVPLTVHRRTILKQILTALDQAKHQGRRLDPAKSSQAPFKLHTLLYRVPSLSVRYWILLYRNIYPKVPVWTIGDRLQVAHTHRVRGVDRDKVRGENDPFQILQAVTGRHLYQAEYLLANMNRGEFPNSERTKNPIDYSEFFGPELADEYKKFAIPDKKTRWCEWREILKENHRDELLDQVFDMNTTRGIGEEYPRGRGDRLEPFVLGKTDLFERRSRLP